MADPYITKFSSPSVRVPPEAGWWFPALKADTHKGCPKGVGVRGDPDYPVWWCRGQGVVGDLWLARLPGYGFFSKFPPLREETVRCVRLLC